MSKKITAITIHQMYVLEWKRGKSIVLSDRHFEPMALVVLTESEFVFEIDPKTMYDILGITCFTPTFLDDWESYFNLYKETYNHIGGFNPRVKLPSRPEDVLEFWKNIYLKEDPIYYASALFSIFHEMDFSRKIGLLKDYWIAQRRCPFFEFCTFHDLVTANYPVSDIGFFIDHFFILSGYQNFEYLKSIEKRAAKKLTRIFNKTSKPKLAC